MTTVQRKNRARTDRPQMSRTRLLAEDHCFVAVHEHPMLGVPCNGSRQDSPFDVLTKSDEFLHAHLVVNPVNVLLDDGALIKVSSDVVRGGANEFDSPVMGTVVRACSFEGGEEGVVNVYDSTFKSSTQSV